MKTRIISALVALVLLFTVLFLFDTIVLNVVVSAIAALAVYELLNAAGYNKHKGLKAVSIVFAAILPMITYSLVRALLPLVIYVYIVIICCILIKDHKTVTVEQLAFSILAATFIPMALTIGVLLRDVGEGYLGLYYVCVALAAAWVSDTGAYFVGVFFGKKKLCPEVSPKKTVEGAIGGIVTCLVFLLLFSFGFAQFMAAMGVSAQVNYITIAVTAPTLSILSIIGDLTASCIKRQYGVKDFGNIMPGHGGALDRFDSVLMVIPAIYIIFRLFPFISII